MKTIQTLILLAGLSASISIRVAAQPADAPAPPETIEADTTNMTTIDTVPEPPPDIAAPPQPSEERPAPPAATAGEKTTESAAMTNQTAATTNQPPEPAVITNATSVTAKPADFKQNKPSAETNLGRSDFGPSRTACTGKGDGSCDERNGSSN